MKYLTEEEILEINEKAPYDSYNNEQGVFFQPTGIPDNTKDSVVYMRWLSGGYRGGSCWGGVAAPFEGEYGSEGPEFKVLDIVLEKLMPNIGYLQFKKVSALIKDSTDSEWEYYGNSTNYEVRYILLSELYELLETFTLNNE